MQRIFELKQQFPKHIAFNLALLLRRVRPVVQIDNDGEQSSQKHVSRFRCMFPSVQTIEHSQGTLLFFEENRMPARVQSALAALRTSKQGMDVTRLVGRVLELVCPARDKDNVYSFRVLLGVVDLDGDSWFFKQQMCARTNSIRRIYRELDKYEAVADEMGMLATTMQVVRGNPKYR